jgi:dCTP diphosphatase
VLIYHLRKKQAVSYEMADILIYLLRIAERLDIDVLKATQDKIAINEQRYPADKVKGDARRANEY